MRVITLAILLVPSIAAADSFFEIAGGFTAPMGDDDWNDTVESSPKLKLAAGGMNNQFGGFFSADWAPENTDAMGGTFPGGSTDISAHRFRLLVGPAFEAPLNRMLVFTGRVGIGADITHASARVTILGSTSETSDTDVGFGFEVGAGLWARVGSLQLGGEVGIPIGHHDHAADDSGEIAMEWTSYDFDVLFGVRFQQ
jgi:hypothetical protein